MRTLHNQDLSTISGGEEDFGFKLGDAGFLFGAYLGLKNNVSIEIFKGASVSSIAGTANAIAGIGASALMGFAIGHAAEVTSNVFNGSED